MKRIWVIAVIGLALVPVMFAFVSPVFQYGHVTAVLPEAPFDPLATISISSWQDKSLLADFDSALERVKHADILIIALPPDEDIDSARMKDIAGRFTPFNLTGLPASGKRQWFGPLILLLKDSTQCPIFLRLRARRWTEIIIGTREETSGKVSSAYTELLRRYRRERTDRMEEMFRK